MLRRRSIQSAGFLLILALVGLGLIGAFRNLRTTLDGLVRATISNQVGELRRQLFQRPGHRAAGD